METRRAHCAASPCRSPTRLARSLNAETGGSRVRQSLLVCCVSQEAALQKAMAEMRMEQRPPRAQRMEDVVEGGEEEMGDDDDGDDE